MDKDIREDAEIREKLISCLDDDKKKLEDLTPVQLVSKIVNGFYWRDKKINSLESKITNLEKDLEWHKKNITPWKSEEEFKILESKLDECRKAAGSDVDCDPLEAVKELRNDYQEALKKIECNEQE